MEPLTGSRRDPSRLPQYLMKAILGWAIACVENAGMEGITDSIIVVYHEDNP